jgi:hypothetical protein
VCTSLKRLVLSNSTCTLSVLELLPDGAAVLVGTMGSHGSGPGQFRIGDMNHDGWSGGLAFTVCARPTLLVADGGNDRVQEVDVLSLRYLRDLCTVPAPRCVAASPALLAVSSWARAGRGDHVVLLFHAVTRVQLRTVAGTCGGAHGLLNCPYGLALSSSEVFVADSVNHRVCVFAGDTGRFVRLLPSKVALREPVAVALRRGGTLVLCAAPATLEFVPDMVPSPTPKAQPRPMWECPALAPGFRRPCGLAVTGRVGTMEHPNLFVREAGREEGLLTFWQAGLSLAESLDTDLVFLALVAAVGTAVLVLAAVLGKGATAANTLPETVFFWVSWAFLSFVVAGIVSGLVDLGSNAGKVLFLTWLGGVLGAGPLLVSTMCDAAWARAPEEWVSVLAKTALRCGADS